MIFGLYHNAQETAGSILDVLQSVKLPFKAGHLYRGEGLPRDTSDLEALIVMGGGMNVDEIDKYPFLLGEVQLIEKVLKEKKPVLGICLGAQLIAKALGEKVYPHHRREVGWRPIQLTKAAAQDTLFKDLPKSFDVLHWHGDTFDLPKGAVHLASSEICENQAFRWGDSTYGLQFHLEATPSMIRSWCSDQEGKDFIRSAGEDPDNIVKATRSCCETLRPTAEKFFRNYLKLALGRVPSSF